MLDHGLERSASVLVSKTGGRAIWKSEKTVEQWQCWEYINTRAGGVYVKSVIKACPWCLDYHCAFPVGIIHLEQVLDLYISVSTDNKMSEYMGRSCSSFIWCVF